MSDSDRSEVRAFRELETLVRHLGEELATFRKRALSAETQLKDAAHAKSSKDSHAPSQRVAELEAENAILRQRLESLEDRVRQMFDRVRFLRQQLQSQAQSPAGAGGGGRS